VTPVLLVWKKSAFVAEMTMCNRIVLPETYVNHGVAHGLETRGAAPFFLFSVRWQNKKVQARGFMIG
jgi:hypothetical protein